MKHNMMIDISFGTKVGTQKHRAGDSYEFLSQLTSDSAFRTIPPGTVGKVGGRDLP